MKNIITTAIFTAFAMFAFSALHAQSESESKYRTDVPISQQIKKGLVPGAKFAPVTTQLNLKPQPVSPDASIRESFSSRLKKGSVAGLKYQTGGGAARAAAPKQAASNVALASSAAAKKKDDSKKADLKPVTLPSQDDKGTPKANN